MSESENKPRLNQNTPPRPSDIDAIPEVSQPTKATRAVNKIAAVALLIVASILVIVLTWAFEPRNVIDINNAPVPVRSVREHAEADGVIIMKIDFCKHKNVSGKARASFISQSREAFLPAGQEVYPAHCDVREFPLLIPKDLPVGKYKAKFYFDYQINPIVEVREEFESQEFEVVDGQVKQ